MKLSLICLVVFMAGTFRGTFGNFVCDNCKIQYRRVGCYQDQPNNRALGEYILSERDKYVSVFNGYTIDWQNFDAYLPAFTCRCAKIAKKKGYKYFGLQFWGECWSAPVGQDDYKKHGGSSACFNTAYGQCGALDKHCVGDQWTNFVYEIYEECSYKFKRIGCYYDAQEEHHRPLNDYVLTDRDPSNPATSGISIDWQYYDTYMPEFACRCAKETVDNGYDIFGLQYYGECWSDADAINRYFTNGTSSACINQCYEPCTKSDKYCIGKGLANFVYRIVDTSCAGDLTTTHLGCYGEDPNSRVLDVLLIDDVHPNSAKFMGEYFDEKSEENWNKYIKDLTCRCSIIAHEKGYPVFGIFNGGECWASSSDSSYGDHGSSNSCYKKPGAVESQCVGGPHCAGNDASIYVHKLN